MNTNELIERYNNSQPDSPAEGILFSVFDELVGRSGFDHWWYAIEGGTQAEILENLRDLIEGKLQVVVDERGDRLEAMIDRMSETISECVLLIWPLYDLAQQIEICGASEDLTKAVTMAGDIREKLMKATGVTQLPERK